jgi:predicted PurR-regulated permease PerM
MSDNTSEIRKLALGNAAALTALALSMVGVAALLYSLIDLLVVFFLGIVVAAALQPGHVRLCGLGVPKGLAVLLIYLFFILGIALDREGCLAGACAVARWDSLCMRTFARA